MISRISMHGREPTCDRRVEQLAVSAGFSAQHVPFRGAANGRIDFAVSPATSAIGLIRDGRLVPLAISIVGSVCFAAQCPDVLEAGLTAQIAYPFYTGVYLPAKTPRAIVVKLHDEVMKAFAT